jgi:hypothetical protein
MQPCRQGIEILPTIDESKLNLDAAMQARNRDFTHYR